jgi:hypothetical protein
MMSLQTVTVCTYPSWSDRIVLGALPLLGLLLIATVRTKLSVDSLAISTGANLTHSLHDIATHRARVTVHEAVHISA